MIPHEYAPERLVRLTNDPIYRLMMWFLNRNFDGAVFRYRGDRHVEIFDYSGEEWDRYETGQAAAVISVAPLFAYVGLIGVVGMHAPGTLGGLVAVVLACALAFVSLNDCCDLDLEYHALDEGEVIGRARSGEVVGS